MTTVHPRYDTRIWIKEVGTLATIFGQAVLAAADGHGDRVEGGRRVVDLGRSQGRITGAVSGSWRAFRTTRGLGPEIVHLHDPELLPLGLLLRLLGTKVIYDVHEDLPRQILSKPYLAPVVRRPVSWIAEALEWIAGRAFSGIVAATPAIARRFPPDKTVLVQNFPLLDELFRGDATPYSERPAQFAYVGGLARIRCAQEMVDAIGAAGHADATLAIAGKFQPAGLEQEVAARPGWRRVRFLGWADRSTVADLLAQSRAGLVLFRAEPNHVEAQPNKLFEYMAAGLPVIASDFPLWRSVVEGAGCGLLVDPESPAAIAAALDWMLDHPEEAETMGRRGRAAVEATYNWEPEAKKLVDFYRRLGVTPTGEHA